MRTKLANIEQNLNTTSKVKFDFHRKIHNAHSIEQFMKNCTARETAFLKHFGPYL